MVRMPLVSVVGFLLLALTAATGPEPVDATEVPVCNHKACVDKGDGVKCEYVVIWGTDTNCTDPLWAACGWDYCGPN